MRTMKESGIEWVKDIPSTWDVAYLSAVLSERKHKNLGMKENNLLSLSYGNVIRKDISTNDGLLPESFEGYNVIEKDDIVLRLTDLQNDHRSLRTGLCKERGIITSAYCTLKKNSTKCDSRFLQYYLHSFDICKGFYGMGAGVRQGLNYDGIRKIEIVLPPFAEQATIADCIVEKTEKVDALIANQEAQIVKLKAYKQSLITEVVTKGLDPNVPMKDSGVEWIEKIPEGWNAVPLKTLFDFGKGLPITKENLVEEGIPVISYGQIHAKWNSGVTIHEELKRFVNKEYLETNPSCLVKKGDFIIADTSEDREGCGNAAYVNTDDTIFAGYHTVVLISKKPNVDNKYLAYLFLTDAWRSQLRKRVSGIKVFSVSRKFLSETSVLIPDNASKMVELLDEKCSHIDKLISIKQQKIERLNQYKKSIIYEYVTGKKEV